MKVSVEVCVTSVAEALVAQGCGADTVELCICLDRDGLTPSPGLLREVLKAVHIPVRVLVRPVANGFVHDQEQAAVLDGDVEWTLKAAARPRLVVGALRADGSADHAVLKRALSGVTETTFHRAIDHARDPIEVLEECIRLGYHRVLTSGGAPTAVEGMGMLRRMVALADEHLTVAAAGRIGPDNVLQVVRTTGVREVHFAARSNGNGPVLPDRAKIEGVLTALDKAGLR